MLALNNEKHRAELASRGIPWIDLVCIDLYPLEQEIQRTGATLDSILELEDIGGPTALDSGGKAKRIVICDPADRESVMQMLESGQPFDEAYREHLAAKAKFVVSRYRMLTARYRGKGVFEAVHGVRVSACLYGENAYQTPAALYSSGTGDPLALDKFKLIEGTAPSYNNWVDLDRMLQTLTHVAAGVERNEPPYLDPPLIACAVKHGNACGASFSMDSIHLLKSVVLGDPLAIHGGLVLTNFTIGIAEAEVLLTHGIVGEGRRLLDAVVAPAFSAEAVEMLRRKKDKCRFLQNSALATVEADSLDTATRFRYVRGGFLCQPNYIYVPNFYAGSITRHGPERNDYVPDLILAWAVGATSNSNTITLVKGRMLIGNGVGQQDRVGAAKLAIERARRSGHDVQGAVAYSDSFFPFPDGPQSLIDVGVKAILTSSGSVNDQATIDLCVKNDVSLFMVPDKGGRGFFGH